MAGEAPNVESKDYLEKQIKTEVTKNEVNSLMRSAVMPNSSYCFEG